MLFYYFFTSDTEDLDPIVCCQSPIMDSPEIVSLVSNSDLDEKLKKNVAIFCKDEDFFLTKLKKIKYSHSKTFLLILTLSVCEVTFKRCLFCNSIAFNQGT